MRDNKQQLEMADINILVPYRNHPFKLYTGKRLDDMVSSIKDNGIITPIIVHYVKDSYPSPKYEILSGHNRVNAAKILGIKRVPVIAQLPLTAEEARIIVTETNLMQRSFGDLSHSERAICLAHHYEAMKCQGKRNDLLTEVEAILDTCVHTEHKKSRDKISGKYKLSATNVSRYIRLSRLAPELLELVDNSVLAFLAAYQLSFIGSKNIQKQIAEYICDGSKVDVKRATLLRELYEDSTMTEKNVGTFMCQYSMSPKRSVMLSAEIVDKYFAPQLCKEEIVDGIEEALQFYFDNMQGGNADEG